MFAIMMTTLLMYTFILNRICLAFIALGGFCVPWCVPVVVAGTVWAYDWFRMTVTT